MPSVLTPAYGNPSSSILSVAFPSDLKKFNKEHPVDEFVLNSKIDLSYGEGVKIGKIERIARSENDQLAISHSTSQISVFDLPKESSASLSSKTIVNLSSSIPSKPIKSLHLSFLSPTTILHASTTRLSHVSLNSEESAKPRRIGLPANLKALESTTTHFAYAGKEVDVSLWDAEAAFASSSSSESSILASESSKKRKGKAPELFPGEIWRAKNIPNDFLSLRPEISHLCLAFAPNSLNSIIITGCGDGTVRYYDTKQRRPVHVWKAAKETGVGIGSIHCPAGSNEVYFGDKSFLLGSLDIRTGRVLYNFKDVTATPVSIHSPITASNILFSASNDATLRMHTRSLPPKDPKGNVPRGLTIGRIGGVGSGGVVFGWKEDEGIIVDKKEREGEEDDDDDEAVWEGMGLTGEGENEEESEEDEDDEDEEVIEVDEAEDDENEEDEDDSDSEEEEKRQPAKKHKKK